VNENDVVALVRLLGTEAGEVEITARLEGGDDEAATVDELVKDRVWPRLVGFDLSVQGVIGVVVRDWAWNAVTIVWSPEQRELADRVVAQVRRWTNPLQLLCYFGLLVAIPAWTIAAFLFVGHVSAGLSRADEATKKAALERLEKKDWPKEEKEAVVAELIAEVKRQWWMRLAVSAAVWLVVGAVVLWILKRIELVGRFADVAILWWTKLFPTVYFDFASARHSQWPPGARWIAWTFWIASLSFALSKLLV